jgi:hypothetical protein
MIVQRTYYDPPLNVVAGETVYEALARQPHVVVTHDPDPPIVVMREDHRST